MPTAANHVFRNSYAKVKIPCELRRCTTADDAMCQIFQMHPCDVTFDNLPGSWLVGKQEFNTIVLPCKHTFHVSALALHFVLTDMRCPVCRCGHQYRADINSLPKCYQEAFDKRKKEIKDTTERSEWMHDVLENVEIHMAPLENDLNLVVDISQANQSRWIVQSPVRRMRENDDAPDQPLEMYRAQQSFLRSFNAALTDFLQRVPWPHQDVSITFALVHPVFALTRTVRSASIPFAEFLEPTRPRAWPICFDDNGENRVAGAIVTSYENTMRQVGIFIDRHLIIGLCIASIHAQLQTILQ